MLSTAFSVDTGGEMSVEFSTARGNGTGLNVAAGASARISNSTVTDNTTVVQNDGTVDSLRRGSEDVREVASGFECGIVLHNYADVKEGDVLEVYETRSVERALA